jgi:drug/metabolite transporter (DMT)-like permease
VPNWAQRADASLAKAGHLRDWGLLVACNFMWGSQFVLAKLVQEQMGPILATLLPIAIATVCVAPLIYRRGTRAEVSGADIARFAAIGVFGQVVGQLGITWGVRFVPASNAALLSLLLPVVTALMAFALLGERLTRVGWLSFALAIVGVLQCSGVDWKELRFESGAALAGNALIVCGVAGSAFYNVYSKKLLRRYTALEVLLYSYIAVVITLLPITAYLEPTSLQTIGSFSSRVWLGVALLAGFQYFLSMVIFLQVLTRLDATQAGMSNYLIPVFGVLAAAAVFGEHLSARMILGAVLVAGSTLLITVLDRPRARVTLPPDAATAGSVD